MSVSPDIFRTVGFSYVPWQHPLSCPLSLMLRLQGVRVWDLKPLEPRALVVILGSIARRSLPLMAPDQLFSSLPATRAPVPRHSPGRDAADTH